MMKDASPRLKIFFIWFTVGKASFMMDAKVVISADEKVSLPPQ